MSLSAEGLLALFNRRKVVNVTMDEHMGDTVNMAIHFDSGSIVTVDPTGFEAEGLEVVLHEHN